jgi:ATP-dependent Zn protease
MNVGTGKKAVAYHEAGHAVIARVLGVEVGHVSMEERSAGTFNAYYLVKDDPDLTLRLEAIETDTKVSLAGPHTQTR